MRPSQRILYVAISLGLLLAFPVGRTLLYTVNERELAVIVQFGDPVDERIEPGLYIKTPLIQEVRRLPKTYQFWQGNAESEKLVDITTADGKKIEASLWAVWRITEPTKFVRVLRTIQNAEDVVKQVVRGKARDVMTTNDLAEIVRSTDRTMQLTLGLPPSVVQEDAALSDEVQRAMAPEARQRINVGRRELMDQIRQAAQQALSETEDGTSSGDEGRGIELVDIGLSRVEFVTQVREAAFERLIKLMDAIATKNRSEGEQRKQEVINEATAEAEKIRGEGTERANILRGEVEARIITNFAQAIEDSEGFYDFNRTLELYKKALSDSDTNLILSTNNPLLKLITDFNARTELIDPSSTKRSTEITSEPEGRQTSDTETARDDPFDKPFGTPGSSEEPLQPGE